MTKKVVHPEMCLTLEPSTIDPETGKGEVIAIKFGETGYYPTTYENNTQGWINTMNARMGINKVHSVVMSSCSVFGNWQNYDKIYLALSAKVSEEQ